MRISPIIKQLPDPFMQSGFFYFSFLNRFISYISGVWLVIIVMFVEISELNATNVDPY